VNFYSAYSTEKISSELSTFRR